MVWLLIPIVSLFILIAPLWAIVAIIRQRRELRELRERLGALEQRVVRGEPPLTAVPPPMAEAAPLPLPPEPIQLRWSTPAAREGAAASPAPSLTPSHPPMVGAATASAAPAARGARARGFDSSRVEELIGSVWLQNVGAVLLLLGVFFLILWGYTTGRFGPGVLVAAGVVLGITLAWRGDRVARSLPPFGHALIGVGLGTVYLSLYLGHFTLRVLPPTAAFAALVMVSIGSVAVGMRYRVQTIAVLGVLGAFVPQLMAAWIPLKGFTMSPPGLLGYFAAVDAVVFLLAARAGWSALDLAALSLTTITWAALFHGAPWGWGVQAGLSALFTALGLSPLPRLVSREGTVRDVDMAAIALAPLCLVASSWPFLVAASRGACAVLLFSLAAAHLLAAVWVDVRRPERDLWRPVTGAAVLFLTAALERWLGAEWTPMAWCVEGALLVWLGLRERGQWLRRCGHVVLGLGMAWVLVTLFGVGDWRSDQIPGFYPSAIRELVCICFAIGVAWLLARGRAHLSMGERYAPEVWAAVGNLLVLIWVGREAIHLGFALEGRGGRWAHAPDPVAPRGDQRVTTLTAALMALFWVTQSAILVAMSRQAGRGFLRACGYVAGALGAVAALAAAFMPDGWSSDQLPVLNLVGLLRLAAIGLIAAMAAGLARRRELLGKSDARSPETLTLVACLLLLSWTALEADHIARAIAGIPGTWAPRSGESARVDRQHVSILAASFTSAGWLVQALVLLVLGWMRHSAFLRWSGLVLIGITVLKFLVVDLQSVDVFWRFLTAIVVGAALLGISYAYQRRARAKMD